MNGQHADAVHYSVIALEQHIPDESKCNQDLFGEDLMNHVFSSKNPLLKFNELNRKNEENEQQGFMYLFKGVVTAIRNPRAHKLINDNREKALEYIAFISLLAKLVDGTKKPF